MKSMLALLLLAVVARAQQVVNDDSRCINGIPAFFEMKNADLSVTSSTDFFGITKKQCLTMCTDNLDIFGNEVQCASMSYNDMTSVCRIYRVKSKPDGAISMKPMNSVTYYEKFCLPATAPPTCGEARFRREQQMVLVGFARNVSVVPSLEECVAVCINEPFQCRSAVYFSDVGECITNTGAAMDNPQTFLEEETDVVTYFDNGCVVPPADKLDDQVRNNNVLSVIDAPPRTRTKQPAVSRLPVTTTPAADPQFEHQAGYTQWTQWSKCDRPDGRRIRRRQCQMADVRQCKFPLLQVQWCSEAQQQPDTGMSHVKSIAATTPRRTTPRFNPTTARQTTTAAPITAAPVVTRQQIVNEPTDETQSGWGAWRTDCNKFVTAQPCEDGVEIGFQTRTCQGNPEQCQGPFFRYCTLPC